jgi:hypothetical protein
MKKQIIVLSLLATSLIVLPGCWKSTEEKPKKKIAFVDDKVTKKPSKELIENNNDDILNLTEDLIQNIEL